MKLPRSIKRILYIVGLIISVPVALIGVLVQVSVFIPGFGAEFDEFSLDGMGGMCGLNFVFLCIAGYCLQELRGED